MKLSAREAPGFLRDPDRGAAGILIFGDDPMRVAMLRQECVTAVIGPEGADEMRLTRVQASELRRDAALVIDATRAQGFFPGPRVVLVEDATDGLSKTLGAALKEWQPGDAMIIVTAGSALPAKSSLRKVFEGGNTTYAAGLYATPPGRAEIEAELTRAGLSGIGRDALDALSNHAAVLPMGDFRQTLEKIALYKRGDDSPLTAAEVALNAPASADADVDDILNVVAEGHREQIAPVMQRLWAQGTSPVTVMIFALRHFRTLHALVTAQGGPARAIERMRPPIYGPRRDKILRQAGTWRTETIEAALKALLDTDLALRSAGQKAPAQALVERAFVRLTHMARAR